MLIYQKSTETIRQMPQNYMLACRHTNLCSDDCKSCTWKVGGMFTDRAVNKTFAKIRVFLFILFGGVKP